MVFEKYWNEKQQYDANQLANANYVIPTPSQSALFNQSILFKNIEDRDNMSDAELRYFINNNLRSILNNVFDYTVSKKYLDAFQEVRFLKAFADAITIIPFFDQDIIVRTNLIVYHYITQPYKKQEVVDEMMKIASIINRSKLSILKSYDFPENFKTWLVVARYSDFNMNICVKRVNMLMLINPQSLTSLNIDVNDIASEEAIDTLSKLLVELFNTSEWSIVLPYFMLDVLPEVDDTPSTQWITPEVEAIDSTISLAILHILDTIIPDSKTLANILKTYAEGYRILNNKKPIRFSFQTISEDYPRLKSVIEYLSNNEQDKIYVP